MRRSGANKKAKIPERPVLPRPLDAVNDGLAVLQDRLPELRASPKPGRDDELASTVASSADLDNEWNFEVGTGDFRDAYTHFAVKEEELNIVW